jgi:hypothetical protein
MRRMAAKKDQAESATVRDALDRDKHANQGPLIAPFRCSVR